MKNTEVANLLEVGLEMDGSGVNAPTNYLRFSS
jgi:hypothetical protein